MIHHIRNTFDGFISALAAIGFFTISGTTVDWAMKIVSFSLGSIVSVLASVYYVKAIRRDSKSRGRVEKL
jgi:membrane protein implicated in regulation of membrane protease activity